MAVARPAGHAGSQGRVPSAPSSPPRQLPTALPAGWEQAWRSDGRLDDRLDQLRGSLEELALDVSAFDCRDQLSGLVSASDLSLSPIHRWYSYKEGFSPRLPHLLLELVPSVRRSFIADVFGGVGTTPLTLQFAEGVETVVGVEYSPFAQFVGATKLAWTDGQPARLERHALRLARATPSHVDLPELKSFHDDRIFRAPVARALVSARNEIQRDKKLTPYERDFFLLGLASIVEDVSGAVKDGRALRVANGRRRNSKALRPQRGAVTGTEVAAVLLNQWRAMIEDLHTMAPLRTLITAATSHHRGDARSLSSKGGCLLFTSNSVDTFIYSPPYLNCIDYTEVYKLELWLLEFVTSQEAFRDLRLGTLRSHPSVEFPATSRLEGHNGPVVEAITALSAFVEEEHIRPANGRMIRNYFEDMFATFTEQFRLLKSGGTVMCVVANSTFSRREKVDGQWRELWRLPIPSDLILAGLARLAGFQDVELWDARALRPRNVENGAARESVLIARKSSSRHRRARGR